MGLELILWCLLNYHQGSSMLETIFLFLIVSSTVESQIQHRPKIRQRDEGREVKCARGWVRYGGGYTRDNWRIDGGCFTLAARLNNNENPQDCDAAWALCAENNKQLATFRPEAYSSRGTKPLTWKTLKDTVTGQTCRGCGTLHQYVCLTKYDGYTETEANIQRSRR